MTKIRETNRRKYTNYGYPTIFTDPVHPMNQAIKKYLNLYRIKYNSHEYHSKIRHDSSV